MLLIIDILWILMLKKVKVKKLRKERYEIWVNYYICIFSYFIIDVFLFYNEIKFVKI